MNLLTGQDLFNYAVEYTSYANNQIHCILKFKSRINEKILSKAVRLTFISQPILGCRVVVEDQQKPFWKKIENLDQLNLSTVVESQDVDDELHRFVTSPLDSRSGPQLQTRLIRSEFDTLCIKINHSCSDARGLKEYVALLAEVYTNLYQNPYYIPKLDSSGRRDQYQVFEELGITDPIGSWNKNKNSVKPTWSFPSMDCPHQNPTFSIRRLDKQQLEKLSDYARNKDITINDIILTAFYRSMFQIVQPQEGEPMGVEVTVDLRRYLPKGKTDSICNLSASTTTYIAKEPGESFATTLTRVSEEMKRRKKDNLGLRTVFVFEVFAQVGFTEMLDWLQQIRKQAIEHQLTNPFFSNFGLLSKEKIFFYQEEVVDAYMISPIMLPPTFLIGISTYDDILTLTVCYYESSIKKEFMEKFLEFMTKELNKKIL